MIENFTFSRPPTICKNDSWPEISSLRELTQSQFSQPITVSFSVETCGTEPCSDTSSITRGKVVRVESEIKCCLAFHLVNTHWVPVHYTSDSRFFWKCLSLASQTRNCLPHPLMKVVAWSGSVVRVRFVSRGLPEVPVLHHFACGRHINSAVLALELNSPHCIARRFASLIPNHKHKGTPFKSHD